MLPHLPAVGTAVQLRHAPTHSPGSRWPCRMRPLHSDTCLVPVVVSVSQLCSPCPGSTPGCSLPACPSLLSHLGAWPGLVCCQLAPLASQTSLEWLQGVFRCRTGSLQLRVWGTPPPESTEAQVRRGLQRGLLGAPASAPPVALCRFQGFGVCSAPCSRAGSVGCREGRTCWGPRLAAWPIF